MKRRKLTRLPKEREAKLQRDFKKASYLRFQLTLARELGMTLRALREQVTEEELEIWALYFAEESREREAAERRASMRR